MNYSNIRSICRENIESLELWLRRIIDDTLSSSYGDYFNYQDANGNRLIKSKIIQDLKERCAREPERYPRKVDAILLDDAIDIICKPDLYNKHFREALSNAFPHGCNEARVFLQRISAPRNNLSHSNPISIRQAEQIICYSHDVIDSLKVYYEKVGMKDEYNAPLITRFTDSFGSSFVRNQFKTFLDSGVYLNFCDDPRKHLRPGERLSIEVEVDPSYHPDQYIIRWRSKKTIEDTGTNMLNLVIENKHVGYSFDIQCHIIAKRDWHRLSFDEDDCLIITYKVLPPIA